MPVTNAASGTSVHEIASGIFRISDVLFQTDDAPFDREAGEVLIACQKHFSALPPNIVIGVRSRDASGNEGLAAYAIPHVFV